MAWTMPQNANQPPASPTIGVARTEAVPYLIHSWSLLVTPQFDEAGDALRKYLSVLAGTVQAQQTQRTGPWGRAHSRRQSRCYASKGSLHHITRARLPYDGSRSGRPPGPTVLWPPLPAQAHHHVPSVCAGRRAIPVRVRMPLPRRPPRRAAMFGDTARVVAAALRKPATKLAVAVVRASRQGKGLSGATDSGHVYQVKGYPKPLDSQVGHDGNPPNDGYMYITVCALNSSWSGRHCTARGRAREPAARRAGGEQAGREGGGGGPPPRGDRPPEAQPGLQIFRALASPQHPSPDNPVVWG
eukprot:scaffold4595_cov415-Prasinococcus_capsulatus_cf.AAC.1